MLEGRRTVSFLPDPDPSWGTDPLPFVLLMLAGFVVGTTGHVYGSKPVVVVGIAMIFLATFLLPLGIYVSRS
jgi:hypothetical protein